MNNTFETPFDCPSCKKQLDASTTVQGEGLPPQTGDLSICFSCGAYLEFTGPLSVVLLTGPAFNQLDAETKRTLVTARLFVISRNPP
jgi:hypothetical protein